MTINRQAKLAFITQPEPGRYAINLKYEEPGIERGQGPFERVEITREQLCNLVADGAHLMRPKVEDVA